MHGGRLATPLMRDSATVHHCTRMLCMTCSKQPRSSQMFPFRAHAPVCTCRLLPMPAYDPTSPSHPSTLPQHSPVPARSCRQLPPIAAAACRLWQLAALPRATCRVGTLPPYPSKSRHTREHTGNRRPVQQPRAVSGNGPRPQGQPAALRPSVSFLRFVIHQPCSPPRELPPPASSACLLWRRSRIYLPPVPAPTGSLTP